MVEMPSFLCMIPTFFVTELARLCEVIFLGKTILSHLVDIVFGVDLSGLGPSHHQATWCSSDCELIAGWGVGGLGAGDEYLDTQELKETLFEACSLDILD